MHNELTSFDDIRVKYKNKVYVSTDVFLINCIYFIKKTINDKICKLELLNKKTKEKSKYKACEIYNRKGIITSLY